jgi:uncharacterized protein (TIGR02145 family)
MKNLFAALVLLIFGLVANLPAQTLKNIYRHNQPVLRIPTHLIDKVETAEVNGTQVLQVRQFNGFVSEIPLSVIDSITHSEGEAVDPAQLGNLRTASVMGVVSGPTGAPEMNAIVRSPFGGEETRTDPNGVFFLNNILVYDKLGYITITKPGFHQASRSFLPLETGSSRVNVQLLPMTQSGTFSAATGGTVTSGLLQLTFPANSVTLNGQPYTGTVRVYAAALDPTSTSMFDQMPGELLGGLNDSLRLLRSFGMASVELRDDNMNELQLATGVNATLTFNIPTSLQAEAPETIDWWSFDETLGYWKHEGEAQKQGTQYIGLASHFSWWNLDVPGTFNEFLGIVNSLQGIPLTDAKVNLVSTTLGTATTYTNFDGIFSGRVPKNQSLTLGILLTCNTTNDWTLAYSENLMSGVFPIVGTYTASLSEYYQITGTVLNCSGLPVESGYVKMGANIFSTDNGQFAIQTCSVGTYTLRGYDTSTPDSIKASALDTIQVMQQLGNVITLQACSQFFGEVSDIENNVYSTVIIGDQLWMAENLRTATYANGDPIPNVTGNFQWSNLSTGAWCNYDNNVLNDSLYGKLYNWYTVADARNLCPNGWHVPSSLEWEVLVDLLGGELSAGGKMKSIVGWESPNQGATNESGFSGLPGGYRFYFQGGYFSGIGFFGYWWSSTTQPSTSNAWSRTLNYSDDNASLASYAKKNGLSVRCIRD